jgi:redox-sensitive bicupin YhaK (pirin superfamily)
MEIVTYVREGVVTHRDSLGNEGQTKAGDVRVMSRHRYPARRI